MTHSPSSAQSAFERALQETYRMVDPLNPPPSGTYYRGQHEGIIAALKTIRANFDRAAASVQATELTQFQVSAGGKWTAVTQAQYEAWSGTKRIANGATPPSPDAREAGGGVWLSVDQLADIRRAAVVIRENSYPCPDKPHSNWALAERIDALLREAGK